MSEFSPNPLNAVTFQTTDQSARAMMWQLFGQLLRVGADAILPANALATVVLLATGQYTAIAISYLLLIPVIGWFGYSLFKQRPNFPTHQQTHEIHENGLRIVTPGGWTFMRWPLVDDVTLKSDHIFVASLGYRQVGSIPVSAFDSPKQAQAFAESIERQRSQPQGDRSPRLTPEAPLSQVTVVKPPTAALFQSLMVPFFAAVICYFINQEVTKADGRPSTVFGVIFFHILAFFAYRLIKLLPFQTKLMQKHQRLTSVPRAVSLLNDGVHA